MHAESCRNQNYLGGGGKERSGNLQGQGMVLAFDVIGNLVVSIAV